jgi:NAD+ synthase
VQSSLQLNKFWRREYEVIGISGGIDSAVVATLCVNAIGKQKVFGVSMPYGNQDTTDANLIIKSLGINKGEYNVIKEVDNNVQKLEQMFDKEIDKISKGNLMARERMKILYGVANFINGIVIGTGNKSELEIGYLTKYGDGGVDIEPIGELYKTEVFELAKFLRIPQNIINKKPSANLWEGQTDEDEMGFSYKELDAVLKGEITEGEIYEKVKKLREESQHKKEMPPIFKIRR